jgi:hypothetical protein
MAQLRDELAAARAAQAALNADKTQGGSKP